jgi:hypothetical protein
LRAEIIARLLESATPIDDNGARPRPGRGHPGRDRGPRDAAPGRAVRRRRLAPERGEQRGHRAAESSPDSGRKRQYWSVAAKSGENHD